MDWFKKHVDTVVVLTGILGSFFWMNHQVSCLESKMNAQFSDIRKDMSCLKEDMAVMKAVLIIKGIMPEALVLNQEKQ